LGFDRRPDRHNPGPGTEATDLELPGMDLARADSRRRPADAISCKAICLTLALLAPACTCTDTLIISSPGSYALNHDLAGGIAIDADDVTLDLNGKTIRCARGSGPETIGIDAAGRSNIRITNGKITGCTIGLNAMHGGRFHIEAVDFSDNHYVGIHMLFGRGRSRIVGNVFASIAGYTKEAYAIGLYGAGSNSLVENNTFRNIVRQSGASGGGEGVAILIPEGDRGVSIRDNSITNEPGTNDIGIWIAAGASAAVERNAVAGFSRGIISGGRIEATGNVLSSARPTPESIGIFSAAGIARDNAIVGYARALAGAVAPDR
jgi:hypothetical protein